MLAAAVYKSQHKKLRVLDLMAGSAVRGSRYLQQVSLLGAHPPVGFAVLPEDHEPLQAAADLVWCNDANPATRRDATHNICTALLNVAGDQGDDGANLSNLLAGAPC